MKKLLLIALAVASLMAAKPVSIGTGGTTGNYYGMTNDIMSADYCGKMMLGASVVSTGGSVDNLLGMINKKYAMGVVQSDVLMSMSKTSPRKVNANFIKIVAGLHNETVHLLIPNGYKPAGKSNMWSSLFSSKNTGPIKLSSLQDQVIASWGGSITSAKAISYFMGLNWNVQSIDPSMSDKVKTPIVIVGGQPYAPVEKLIATGKWRLLSIDANEIKAKAPFYLSMEANYKVNGSPVSVSTIGVQALLVGKAYRKQSRNDATMKFAACIDDSLADLADDPDTNPNWASVYENNEQGSLINWPFFSTK